jgi:CheY-like chemotaxis protein
LITPTLARWKTGGVPLAKADEIPFPSLPVPKPRGSDDVAWSADVRTWARSRGEPRGRDGPLKFVTAWTFSVGMPDRLPPRVLVVEDDDAISALIGRTLQREGCVVISVRDGQQALVQLARDPSYDVIVLDLCLPLLHGTEVYAALRTRSPELLDRIVFITAAERSEDLDFLGSVSNRRLTKPFSLRAVRDVVAEVARAA